MLATAGKIASMSLPAVMKVKESINAAYETTLTQGCSSSAASFMAPLRWPTRKRACVPSSRSASRFQEPLIAPMQRVLVLPAGPEAAKRRLSSRSSPSWRGRVDGCR